MTPSDTSPQPQPPRPPQPPQATRPSRSRWRTLLFLAVGAVAVVLLIEGTAWVFYGLANGKLYSGAALSAARAELIEGDVADAAAAGGGRARVDLDQDPERAAARRAQEVLRREMNKVVHPFLGFVMNPEDNSITRAAANHWDKPISDYGFFSDESPIQPRTPGTLRVAVTGGSVASIMAYTSSDVLVEELRKIPGLEHQRIDVVNLALPALKQPQQLIALDYMLAQGAGFDVVVNLDGVNDVCMPIVGDQRGVHPSFPDGWNVLMSGVPSVEQQRLVGQAVVLRETRKDLAGWLDQSLLSWSVTCNVLWAGVDRMLESRVQQANLAVQDAAGAGESFAVTGPMLEVDAIRGEDTREGEVRVFAQDLWESCSRLMHERCAARGIRYLHLLQPNQYAPGVDKPLTAEEQATAYDEGHIVCRLVRAGYPGLRSRGAALTAEGVAFADLSNIFDGVEASVWIDPCCHLTDTGNRLLARAVALRLEPQLTGAFAPLDLNSVRALIARDAGPLRFSKPFETQQLSVLGHGTATDLTYACDSFRSSDESVARVDRWGRVRAFGPGECRIEVVLGNLGMSMPVSVAFPPVVVLQQGVIDVSDPVLRVVETRDDAWVVEVSPAPAGLQGWIAIGAEPVRQEFGRALAYVDLLHSERVMLPVQDQAGQVVRVAIPRGDAEASRPRYLQAFFLSPAKTSGGTLSNGVAVTGPMR